MKKSGKILAVLTAAVLVAGMFGGCGDTSQGNLGNVSGSISMAGSTSMEKMVSAVNEAFMNNTSVTVTAEFIGSGAGAEAAIAGRAEIANVSRSLADSEKKSGMVENTVAIDGIAMIVNQANTVEDLTKKQLADIYTGKVKNWKDVGGEDSPIVVIGREASSGTREAFETIADIKGSCAYSNELDNTGAVMAKVGATAGAIGYVSLDVVDNTVKSLKMEGIEATAENIKAGTYFLSRPFIMATKGEISDQSEAVQKYFAYLKSDEGKQIIEQVGLISVD